MKNSPGGHRDFVLAFPTMQIAPRGYPWLCAGLARLLVDAFVVSRSSVIAEDIAIYGGAIQGISSTPG